MTDEPHHDLRPRVVNIEHRLSAVEQWRIATDLALVRRDEQFITLKEDIKTIKGTMSKILWLVVGGIISGLVAFMMSGGLKIPH